MKKNRVIEDWVDCDEIRNLAEQLLLPPKGFLRASDETVYGPEFEGFADPQPEPGVTAPKTVVPRKVAPVVKPQSVAEVEPKPVVSLKSQAEPEVQERKEKVVQRNPFRKKEAPPRQVVPESKRESTLEAPVPNSPFRSDRPKQADQGSSTDHSSSLLEFVNWLKEKIPVSACLISRGEKVLYDNLKDPRFRDASTMLAKAAHQKSKGKTGDPRAMVVKLSKDQVMQVIPMVASSGLFFASLILPRPLAGNGVVAFKKAFRNALEK